MEIYMLSSPISLIFFFVFALILVGMYMSIRREWASAGIVTAIGTVGSVIAMLVVSLGQGNSMFQAIVVSVGIGGIFSLSIVAIAIFFHTNEMRDQHGNHDLSTAGDVE